MITLKRWRNYEKLEHLLYQDESVKQVFTPPPMVSYRSTRTLSSHLVFATTLKRLTLSR